MKHPALTFIILLGASSAYAQVPPVRNPTALVFNSIDHDNAALTGYEVDFIRLSDGAVIQTVVVAKNATVKLADGTIKLTLNIQPVAFGAYAFVARAVAGTLKSDNSVASDEWDRVPGPPTKPGNQ